MKRPRLLFVAMVLLMAAAATLPASCTGPKPAAPPPADAELFSQTLHDRLPQAVRDRGVLRVGTNTTYAPMGLFASDGRTIVGVDPDLGAAIGRVLGIRLEFVDTVFAEVLAKVADGDLDLAMSAVTDTPERATKVDFVNYFSAGTSIVVQRGNPAGVTDIKDLCGKVVTVMGGTVQENLLTRAQTNRGDLPMTVRTYASDSDALVKLRTGR